MTLDEALRVRLTETMGPVTFDVLAPHLERDAVVLVASTIELVDAAIAVAQDDTDKVRAWIEDGTFRKPSVSERTRWKDQMGREWTSVVVQPFVLIQDPTTSSDQTSFS